MQDLFSPFLATRHNNQQQQQQQSITITRDKTMKRYLYIDNHEVPLIINTDLYVYVMGFEPFRPIRIRARDTKDSWILFISSDDCIAYYNNH